MASKNLAEDPYERLANAIILSAAADYRAALKKVKRNPKSKSAIDEALQIEKFFRSSWYQQLTSVATMTAGLAVGCGSSSDSSSADSKSSDWDSSNDITIVSREDGSGTRGAFIELFGIEEKKDGEKVDMTTDDAQITNSTSVMLTTVAGDDYAIGYVSLGSLNDTVKALKIDGEEATEQNIKDGKYKICRPFNIATKKGADNEVAKDFIAYIMSKEGQQVISDNGYIGDDSAEAYAGSKPSGKAVVGGSSSVSPVMEKLIEAYKKVNTGAEIELQTTDSTTGMTSAIDGSYDIGMASRELQDEEKDKLDSQVIATDGIAVIVNKNNTTDELSSDQVKTIYTGDATTWDEAVK